MLQLTFGLPFWQWPVPSTLSVTVVNPAPLTGAFANAVGTTRSAAPTAATTTRSFNGLVMRYLLFTPAPPSSGSMLRARRRGPDKVWITVEKRPSRASHRDLGLRTWLPLFVLLHTPQDAVPQPTT